MNISIGDMVLPHEDKEFLYSSPSDNEAEELEVIESTWEDTLGLVVEVLEFYPPREYQQVKIVVEGMVGWTYSDYVWIVG